MGPRLDGNNDLSIGYAIVVDPDGELSKEPSVPVSKLAQAPVVSKSEQVWFPLMGVIGSIVDVPPLLPEPVEPPGPPEPPPPVVAIGLTPAHPNPTASVRARGKFGNRLEELDEIDEIDKRIVLLRRWGPRLRAAPLSATQGLSTRDYTAPGHRPLATSGAQDWVDATGETVPRWSIMTTPRTSDRNLAPTPLLVVAGLWLSSAAFGIGCGGGLKYKVDDTALDAVPAGERQDVFAAQNEVEIARSEQRTAKSQMDQLDRDLDVAKNEKKQADLEVEKAATEQESANASHDENLANSSKHGKEVADLGVKVSTAKLDWLDQKGDWLKAASKAAEAHQEAAQAKVELEKAKLAKQKGIKPGSDFSVDNYQDQWKDKNDDWQSAKKKADSEEKDTKEREEKWKDISTQQAKMKG